jgi:uncharacterized membrane protein
MEYRPNVCRAATGAQIRRRYACAEHCLSRPVLQVMFNICILFILIPILFWNPTTFMSRFV